MLPSSRSFAYHEAIPFSIGVSSSSGSAVNTLLLSSAKVQLIKRNFAWNKGRPYVKIETVVGLADSLRTESPSDYTSALSGKLRLSCSPDSHQSWNVEKCAGKEVRAHIKSLFCENVDNWLCSISYGFQSSHLQVQQHICRHLNTSILWR